MSSKKERQNQILKLIERQQVETQEDLTILLGESGFPTTQATVSRDIRQLGLTKRRGKNGSMYYTAILKSGREEKFSRVFKEGIVNCASAQNIIVIKTVEGMAMAVAAALDHMELPEIIGTIAGDDTILCVTHTPNDADRFRDHLKALYEL